VDFRVTPPLWKRAWFQGILLAVGIASVVSVQRVRAARLIEIERVRSNIALDLHDDIASNLSQISIFSEIAMREAGPDSRAGVPLARIAETARETVECISDVVWSIRPQKEGDLSQRIRRYGSDALTSRQIGVVFRISEEIQHLSLDPNARRQVYLIYKEALHNTVRHAQATAVEISMSVVEGHLVLKIGDNGKGMSSQEEGNGLPGMRGRAQSLGGRLEIHSSLGGGTEVELRAPLKRKWGSRILPD
jgi:signal transduction histidine kinase